MARETLGRSDSIIEESKLFKNEENVMMTKIRGFELVSSYIIRTCWTGDSTRSWIYDLKVARPAVIAPGIVLVPALGSKPICKWVRCSISMTDRPTLAKKAWDVSTLWGHWWRFWQSRKWRPYPCSDRKATDQEVVLEVGNISSGCLCSLSDGDEADGVPGPDLGGALRWRLSFVRHGEPDYSMLDKLEDPQLYNWFWSWFSTIDRKRSQSGKKLL